MAKSKKKIILVLLCIVVLIFGGYKIFNKKNNNPLSTETIVSNVKSGKVSMPYINPAWEEYMELTDEEKEQVENPPSMLVYNYIPEMNLYGDYKNLPSRFTLRDEYPTTQYDQGDAGLCWAYATTTMMESNLKVVNGIDEQLSPQYLNYLTGNKTNYKDDYNPYFRYRELDEGNHISNGLLSCGMIPVKNDKFTIPNGEKLNIFDIANVNNIDYTVAETVEFPLYQEADDDVLYRNMLKSFITKYGGVYAATDAKYLDWASSEYSIVSVYPYHEGGAHAVTIIGWDDFMEWRIYNTPDGEEYESGRGVWIIQNSWDSGEYKRYALPYNMPISRLYGVKEIKERDWDNLYNFTNNPSIFYLGKKVMQFESEYNNDNDGAVTGTMIVSYDKSKYKTEKLNMINFVAGSQNGSYDIFISPDGDFNNFQYIKTVTTDLAGMYKVEVDNINLNGEKFAIKIFTEDGAICSNMTVYTNDVSTTEENLQDIESYVTSGGDISKQYYSNKDKSEYHIITQTKNIENGAKFSYTLYDENHQEIEGAVVNSSYVENGKTCGVIELPKSTELNKKMFVDIIYNGNIVNTVEFLYNPQFYMAGMNGNGTESNPFIITNEEQLACMTNYPSAYYVLGNDIDLTYDKSNYITYNKTAGWEPIEYFSGTLDGKGYAIKNLFIRNNFKNEDVGLFAILDSATVKNIKIENANVTNQNEKRYNYDVSANTGILAGKVIESNISNIFISGNIKANTSNVGALAAEFVNRNQKTIDKITFIGNIEVSDNKIYVGSIIGCVAGRNLELLNICVISKIDSENLEMYGIGGVIGDCIEGVTISNSSIFSEIEQIDGSLYGNILGTGDLRYGNNIATYDGIFYHNISDTGVSPSENEKNTKNIKVYNTLNEFKGTSLETLGLDASVWEYLSNNPYPTLKGQPYYFKEDNIEPVNSYEIHIYDFNEDKKIIDNILPTTIEHYKENINLQEPYTAKVFKGEEEVTEGNIASGMITKIYLNGESVAEYTNIVPGDVDGDGKISSRDVSKVGQYLEGLNIINEQNESYILLAMDFTRDGKVTQDDKEDIQKYVVKIIKRIEEIYYGLIEPYKINKYNSDEEKKTISNIFPATVEHYKENINIQNPYTVKVFKENEEITEGNIATGMITKIYLNDEILAEYTNIVPGDVYMDGKISSRDAGMTQQYLIGMLDNLYETPQYYAMDFTRDGKVRLNDVELIMRYGVKLYEPSEEDYYGENN